MFSEHINTASKDEDNFIRVSTIALNFLIWAIQSCIEPYYELVAETSLTRVEKVLKSTYETLEDQVYQVGLHLWRELLVKIILFDNQVVIEVEGI